MSEFPPTEPANDLATRRLEERRSVEEAGGGVSEGFELAEQDLIENSSHGNQHTTARIMQDASPQEEPESSDYGEADAEHRED